MGLDGAQTLPTWLWLVFSSPAFLTSELFFSSLHTLPVMRGELGMIAPTCNPRPWKAKEEGDQGFRTQSGLEVQYEIQSQNKIKSKKSPKHRYLGSV